MASVFSRNNINRAVLSAVLSTFTLTYTVPVQAIPPIQMGIGFKEAAFIYRVEKLVEKIWKLEKSDNKDKMYEKIIELKAEIETSCGIKVDIGNQMDNLEKQLKNSGVKPPKKEFDLIRKALKKHQKKHNKHGKYLASVMHMDGYEINQYDEDLMFPEPLMAKHGKDKDDKDDDKEEVYIPAQLVFGVTLTLCGLFLMVIPFPVCKPWGERMVASGVVICGNCISAKVDQDHKDGKDKNKKQHG